MKSGKKIPRAKSGQPTKENGKEPIGKCPQCGACADANAPVPPTKLTARQEKFVQGYLVGMPAVKAYEAAYGKVRGAKVSASRLLTSANVSARLHELQQRQVISALMSLDERRQYLRRVVMTPIGEVDHTSDLCQSYHSNGLTESPDDHERGKVALPGGKRARKLFMLKIAMPDKIRAIEMDSKLAGDLDRKATQNEPDDGLLELLKRIGEGP